MNNSSTRHSHSLIDKELDENGVVDKYKEFHKIDFSNSFKKLEEPDYEIRASEEQNNKEVCMKGTREKRVASYVSQLSSGYDAKVQDDYESGDKNGQAGKAETEEITTAPNWKADKRDAIGRAATTMLRRTAARLNKLAELYENDEDLDDLEDVGEEEFEELAGCSDAKEATDKEGTDKEGADKESTDKEGADKEGTDKEAADKESTDKEAAADKEAVHPIEHDPKKDDPGADMDSQTGDNEWVDIGPGSFNDKRDEVGRGKETGQ